ncbi:MAG: alpha-mannosidase, partial [Planctomycetes bacterium]|nr:alpha-mannosidase [Planctomycetota bacterium]
MNLLLTLALTLTSPAAASSAGPDLSKERTLYAIGYSHLDTQWRWDYVKTIREYIPATLRDNFALFEKYPSYVFNFTGSVRYQMMEEYYPELFAKLKEYVAAGRWRVAGSSVDEGDVNVPSSESIVRQILYGNRYFERTFGKRSVDFMLPDCFGFPASLPSIFAHCGLKGFVTQKLTWGSAVGIPFPVGFWEGPDGRGVVAALDPGAYVSRIRRDLSADPKWIGRIESTGKEHGVFADYAFFGTGDTGGAPDERSVQWVEKAATEPTGPLHVAVTASDQLFRDLTDAQVEQLPRYQGDLLLTEHSAGTLTSQAYVKRWNRKGELLADAAERAAVLASWWAKEPYPRTRLETAWLRILANQMHDILPGTSIPKAYEYTWNDQLLALNILADTLTQSIEAIARHGLDTMTEGQPLVVYNALEIERTDVVEATVPVPAGTRAARVFDPSGVECPSQELRRVGDEITLIFLAHVPGHSVSVYDVRGARTPYTAEGLTVSEQSLANGRYTIAIDDNGDVSQIHDVVADRPLLSRPAGLVFLRDAPANWPAWNMDWKDLRAEPIDRLQGPVSVHVIERGPVRVAVEVTREGRDSRVSQVIRLAAGGAGDRVEVDTTIDWHTEGCCLKADFPLAVSNPMATYNWEVGTIQRGNDDPKKYEVPSHRWFDLTDTDGKYGVAILEDCKYGSDKPADDRVRLTLLRTPVCNSYQDQATQDHGHHEMLYAVQGHGGDWRDGKVEWTAARLNQPLRAFRVAKRAGMMKSIAFCQAPSDSVGIRAVKLAEDSDDVIIRFQELHGRDQASRHPLGPTWRFVGDVDGQELPLATETSSPTVLRLPAFSLRAVRYSGVDAFPRVLHKPTLTKRWVLPFDT